MAAVVLLAFAACEQPGGGRDHAASDSGPARDVAVIDTTPSPALVDSTEIAIRKWMARVDTTLFTRWGACPFECCVYRDWLAEGRVVVRERPAYRARVVATIPAGQRLQADSGFVRITSPQLVIVTARVEAYRHERGTRQGGAPDSLAVGDTLLVLEPLGEGHWMMTRGRDLMAAEQFWPSDDGWQPYGGARGRALGRHEAEWWAQVRTADGLTGWIDAYGSDLGNVDACGG